MACGTEGENQDFQIPASQQLGVFAQGAWESQLGPRLDVRTALWGLRTVMGLGKSPEGKGENIRSYRFPE